MLSEQEKKEMIEDAKNRSRRDAFRAAAGPINISFDEYIKALDDLQKIFFQFKSSVNITPTKFNKL